MNKSRSFKVATAVLGLVSTMSLAACTSGGDSSSAGGETCVDQKVKIASAAASFVYLPFYVAQASGYLEDEGLDVETIDLSTGSGIIAGAVSNTVDIALSTFPEVAVAKSEGAPVTAFAQVTDFATNVVIKKSIMDEKGLTADSPVEDKLAALKGLNIGVTGSGSGSDLLVQYLARTAGFEPGSDMKITSSGGGANSVAGFASNRFDAIAISSPQSDIAIERGDGAYLFNVAAGEYPPLANNLYIVALTSDRTLKAKPAVVKCFTAALAHAQKDIQENPEAAAKAAQKFLGEDVDQALYDRAFTSNVSSWAKTPVIDLDGAKAALTFQNTVAGTKLGADLLKDVVNTDLATAAIK